MKVNHRYLHMPEETMTKYTHKIRFVALILCSLLLSNSAAAKNLGWVEEGLILPEGISTKMKLDTGARTSSIDARSIERLEVNGKDWVGFVSEFENPETKKVVKFSFERPVVRRVELRGAGGIDHRITVNIQICVGDRALVEEFTLNNRSKMHYPVLLGRRTLEHLGPIDASKTFAVEPTCGGH